MVAFDTKTDRHSLNSTYIFNIKGVETPLTLPLPPPRASPLDEVHLEAEDSGVDLKMPNDIFFQRTQEIVEKTHSKKYFGPVVPVLTEGILMGKQSPSKDNFRYLGNFLLDKSQMLPPPNTPNQINFTENPKKSHEKPPARLTKVVKNLQKNLEENNQQAGIETTNSVMNIGGCVSGLVVENLERHLENKVIRDDDIKDDSTPENTTYHGDDDDKIKVVLDKTAKTILNDGILALNEERPTNPLNYLGEYILKKAVVPERERVDPRRRQHWPWSVKTFDSFEYFKNPESYDHSLSDPTSPWVTVPMSYEEALEEFSRYL